MYALTKVGTGESFCVSVTTGNTARALAARPDEENVVHFQNEDYIEAYPPPDYNTLQVSCETKAAEAGYKDDTADMDKMTDEVTAF